MNIVPYSALVPALDAILGSLNWQCHLFTEPSSIRAATTLADLTEADFSGYPSGGIACGVFSPATLVKPRAQSVGPLCVFTHNGGPIFNNIRGAYYTDAGATVLYQIDLFAGQPIRLANLGDSLDVTPIVAIRSEFV